ncbi:hypothetical protein JCM10450v2_002178 [Rhodotorula kratochvilovae]
MHALWLPAFLHLHEAVVDHLAQPSIHDVLPLLRVNRHLRQLTAERLLKRIKRCPGRDSVALDQRNPSLVTAFIRIHDAVTFPGDDFAAEFLTTRENDPRELFRPNLDGGDDGGWPGRMDLCLTHFDPTSFVCTFSPAPGACPLPFSLDLLSPASAPVYDPVHGGHHAFQLASPAWFRPAGDGRNSYAGWQLAARPERQPARTPGLWVRCAEERDGRVEVSGEECGLGWVVDYTTTRLDSSADPDDDDDSVPALLSVTSLRLTLIDLFVPPRTAADDLAFAKGGRVTLQEYKRMYKPRGPREAREERRLAAILQRRAHGAA